MRWPFRPPHLTLKPSKKQKNKKLKNEKGKIKQEKPTYTQKWAFQLSVKISFLGRVSKISFLTTWPKKRAPPKHYKTRGFSKLFFEKHMRRETAIFGPTRTKIQKLQLSILPIFFFSNNKEHKIVLKPLFV